MSDYCCKVVEDTIDNEDAVLAVNGCYECSESYSCVMPERCAPNVQYIYIKDTPDTVEKELYREVSYDL